MAKITTLKGWTISGITYSAGYYKFTLEKGGNTKVVAIGAGDIFGADGLRYANNLAD